MNTRGLFAALALLLGLALAPAGYGAPPRQLEWKDLVPKISPDHPFAKLSRYQAMQLHDIAAVRDRLARGEKVGAIELEDEKAATRKLTAAGIDVDALLAMKSEVVDQARMRALSPEPSLNGQLVKIPGYLLPLEFSGKEITEFLLVPWVGACIHTPPPPPNQIVHVKSDRPVGNFALFAPIWVTGRMTTGSVKKSLYLVDGSSDINIAYTMQATVVEPYKE
jgi:hypothetical protein